MEPYLALFEPGRKAGPLAGSDADRTAESRRDTLVIRACGPHDQALSLEIPAGDPAGQIPARQSIACTSLGAENP